MNFLAHLVLAEPSAESRLGNLLGDFCQGLNLSLLPDAVQAGVWRHRAVDRFTDAAPEVQQAKALFCKARRRFAPVIIDVLFDHLLLKHWHELEARDFTALCHEIYQQLWQQRALMPTAMQHTVNAIVQQDWFGSYRDLDNIGKALDRIASRIRFDNQFAGSIDEIRLHLPALESLFLQFYPQLQAHVRQLGQERPRLTSGHQTG
jgi:acyl carrier protein phosphodiesterase